MQVNKLSDEEKEELKNFAQESKKEIRSLTSEELQKTSGGISKGGAIGTWVGAGVGAAAAIGGLVAGRKKVKSLCSKIWSNTAGNIDDSMKAIAVLPPLLIVPGSIVAAGVLGVTAVTAGTVVAAGAAGSEVGYLIGNAADKK